MCWYKVFPANSGGQNGIVHFFKALSTVANVSFITSKNNVSTEANVLPVLSTSKLQFLQWKSYSTILQKIKRNNSDTVIIEHPYYALLGYFKKKYNYQFVVHTHNIEYRRLRLMHKWYWWLVKQVEKIAYKKADLILCKTLEDKDFIEKYFKIANEKISVMPYGTTLTECPVNKKEKQDWLKKKHNITKETKILLFAGSFNYLPNQQALLHLIKDICPFLEKNMQDAFAIIICGTHLTEFIAEQNLQIPDKVIEAGFVEIIEDYFAGVDVFINPVQIGEGVQTKNIDALAYNTNVVCYVSMQNGLPKDLLEQKIFTANSVAEVASATQKALNTNTNTSISFYKKYNWEAQVKGLLEKL